MSMIAGDNPDGLPPTESVLSYLAKELELTSQKITAYHIRSEHAITSGIALVGGILTAAASLKIPTLLVFSTSTQKRLHLVAIKQFSKRK